MFIFYMTRKIRLFFYLEICQNSDMNEMYLMRHGETEWNREKRYQGQLDSPLTETGRSRTLLQKKRIQTLHFSNVYCSPLGRTRNTLNILSPDTDKINFEDGLKEVSLGILQGKTHNELSSEEAEAQHNFWHNPGSFELEGAESMPVLENRVRTFLDKLENEKGPILVVTHTVIIKMILKILESRPIERLWEDPFLHPATILVIDRKNGSTVKEVIHPEEDMPRPGSYTA
ncbi:histidine phosphatase family protein [Oceanispirochaeta sp. M1]|nr:histidine phosphatase family protein [Oceanispirochaeta sp. M1]